MKRSQVSRVVGAAFALSAVSLPGARAADGTTAEQTVAAMNTLWGSHAGLRANHAKGIVAEGRFTATPEAAGFSKASLFDGRAVPVTLRFSDSTGLPKIPDGDANANPHGLSMKFKLADGSEMDVVTNALKFFPVATGEDFLELLMAIAQTKPDSAKPTPVERFMAAHPQAPKAFATIRTPSSFTRQAYHGVNAFVFVNARSERQPFRFTFAPAGGTDYIDPAAAAGRAPDYLMEELPAALAKGPASFTMQAQLAAPGDQTKDSTEPWPADRKVVTLGTLTVIKVVPDSATAEKALLFLPGNLPDGVEASDDPLIAARDQAYAVSFGKRSQ